VVSDLASLRGPSRARSSCGCTERHEADAAEAAIAERRDIAHHVRCQALLNRAAQITSANCLCRLSAALPCQSAAPALPG
jgi:hypothetical protein